MLFSKTQVITYQDLIPFSPLIHIKDQNSKDTPKIGKRGNM